MKRYAVITTVYDPTCYSRENWMADQLWFVGYSKEECLDFVSQKGYNRFLSMDGHQSPCIAEIDPTDIPKSMKSMKDREVYPLCPGNIYDDERDFFYCGEVDNINASYNRDIREWVIDGEKPLEPKKPHKYFKRSNEMKIKENSKITLTIGQLRRLMKEVTTLNEATDQEPLDRMEGDILRLGPCNHQKALCWNLQGFCFTPVKVNPSFSKHMPYMVMCKQDDIWQMHFENFDNFDSKPYLDALYKAFAKTCEEQGIKEINAVGGCTPGGISGISALERYGFHKEYLPTPKTLKAGADGDKTNIYWGGATIDLVKAEKWLNGGKHLQDFLVVGNPEKRYKHPEECPLSEPTGEEKYTLNNTNPRPFMMVR